MKAILINPQALTVTAVDIGEGKLDDLKKAMAHEGLIDIVRLGDVDMIVDDEGLLADNIHTFTFKGLKSPFAGNSLVVGHDDEGNTTALPAYVTADLVQSRIVWLGDASGLERNIGLGLIDRPETRINGELIWQWSA
jgi:hypothetical protein